MAKIKRNPMTKTGPGGQQLSFSKSVEVDGFVFVSGQMAIEKGEIVPGGIAAQTRKTIENVRKVLAVSGCDLTDVVKVNVWLDDPRDFSDFNEVFGQYFEGHLPARSTVASTLVIDGKIEMDVIARKKS